MNVNRYLIIGNGAAGVTAAETIRRRDPAGEITIVSAEPHPMYSRPGLAYVLLDVISPKQVIARQPEWYSRQRVELVYGRAVQLDPTRQQVKLDTGKVLAYDRLLIATGARATPPPYAGSELEGVVYLDTFDGTNELIRLAKKARRAVVIGGGITALELTEGLAHRGVETHYFVRRDRLWSQVFNNGEAKILEERMREHGVIIHYHTEATEILSDNRGRVRGIRLNNGEEFKCDLVGVAIGVKPVLDLVHGTAIKVDRAILVNEFMETNLPNIFAAGDCAQVYDRWTQQYMLDVLWPSAVAEGRAAGLNMSGYRLAYTKGSPFNACLLFGLHIATIGQINPRGDSEESEPEVVQHLSRGSSEVWFTLPKLYASAWSKDGFNTIRLVLSGDYLVGALVMGDQSLADPLRYIIENEIDVRRLAPALRAGGAALRQAVSQYWHQLNAVPEQLPVEMVAG
ncbi:MAG: Nitrite reductase [NAD(P)H] [Anaerolineae bacterium]|nr:Nitrite reductase [NAD(P)H] [Anaerolineae bacterium]